jgi:hemolysin III
MLTWRQMGTSLATNGFFKRTVAAQLHLVGMIAAVVGLVVLLSFSAHATTGPGFWACLVFGLTSILIFAVSTTYHFMNDGFGISKKLELRFENWDHVAIFLFIAGTYTPFLAKTHPAPWNRTLSWMIWAVAAAGIAYVYLRPRLPSLAQHRYAFTGVFLLMGWLLLFRIREAFANLSHEQIVLCLAGAASYTSGAIVYAVKRPNPFPKIFGYHEVWHLAVLMGFGFHYFMILSFFR